MKRILITDKIQRIAEEYRDNLFKNRHKSFQTPIQRLTNLKRTFKDNNIQFASNYIDYIDNIIKNFNEILILHPNEFNNYQVNNFSMLTNDQLRQKILNNKDSFYDLVVKAMRYEDVRDTEIAKYIDMIGIKACTYCNAQYANTLHGTKQLYACYEIDHFKPKSKYPFLCISFFNMQPSCSSCNRRKTDEDSLFNLYTDDLSDINPFEFSLEKSSIVRYMLLQDSNVLKINIDSKNSKLIFNHNKLFKLDILYQSFKDDAEELLWKFKTRNHTYISILIESFKKIFLFKNHEIIRFLYGFYDKEKDIHKRPLTKMKQDLAKQFKIL